MLGRRLRALAAGLICTDMVLAPGGADAARREAAIPGIFNTSVVVANPGDDEALVTLNFRTVDGAQALPIPPSFTVRPGSSVVTYVPNISNLADGRYSLTVESTCYVSVLTNLLAGAPTVATAYTGISDVNGDYCNTLYAPYSANSADGYTSSIVVQNGQGASATINIIYRDADGNTIATETRVIPAYGATLFDQTNTAGLGDGSRPAVIGSDRFVSAVVLVSDGQRLGSYHAMRATDSRLYLPKVYHDYAGYVTALFTQNADRSATGTTTTFY